MTVAEELCDRVAFITDGRLRLIDTPWALKLQYGAPTVRVAYQTSDHTAQAEFSLTGLGDNSMFLGLLRNGSVQTIHSQEATLEDVFIRVTGLTLS